MPSICSTRHTASWRQHSGGEQVRWQGRHGHLEDVGRHKSKNTTICMAGVCESELGIRHVVVQVWLRDANKEKQADRTRWYPDMLQSSLASSMKYMYVSIVLHFSSFTCSCGFTRFSSSPLRSLSQLVILPRLGSALLSALSCVLDPTCLSFSLHTDHSVLVDITTLKDGITFILFSYTIHESCISKAYFQAQSTFSHVSCMWLFVLVYIEDVEFTSMHRCILTLHRRFKDSDSWDSLRSFIVHNRPRPVDSSPPGVV